MKIAKGVKPSRRSPGDAVPHPRHDNADCVGARRRDDPVLYENSNLANWGQMPA
jgi:hypothetical protein